MKIEDLRDYEIRDIGWGIQLRLTMLGSYWNFTRDEFAQFLKDATETLARYDHRLIIDLTKEETKP